MYLSERECDKDISNQLYQMTLTIEQNHDRYFHFLGISHLYGAPQELHGNLHWSYSSFAHIFRNDACKLTLRLARFCTKDVANTNMVYFILLCQS